MRATCHSWGARCAPSSSLRFQGLKPKNGTLCLINSLFRPISEAGSHILWESCVSHLTLSIFLTPSGCRDMGTFMVFHGVNKPKNDEFSAKFSAKSEGLMGRIP